MNYPSAEFDEAIAELCMGSASDFEIAEVHAILRSSPTARDDYLWQTELHSRLAQLSTQMVTDPVREIDVIRLDYGNRAPHRARKRLAVALVAVLLIAIGGWYLATQKTRVPDNEITRGGASSTSQRSKSPTFAIPPAVSMDDNVGSGMAAAGIYRENVRFAIAADAPVIVGTGRSEPIKLGDEVPYSQNGDTLNIWNWVDSPTSRVMKDTRLWAEDVFAVSPDGKTFIQASGRIIDLTTGQESKIDLGGELYLDDFGGNLRRIQHIQFTPDGQHLALSLSNIVMNPSTSPLRKADFSTSQSVQVITFPAGKLVGEISQGFSMIFSRDAKSAFSATPPDKAGQQIVQRDIATGQTLRKYEPAMRDFAYAIELSADQTRLAAFDGAGEIFIWDAATGELKHRVHFHGNSCYLSFSPDVSKLAASTIDKTVVINLASGAIINKFPQQIPGYIRWAADGKSLDIISNVKIGTLTEHPDARGRKILCNVFPAITNWKLDQTGAPK